MWFEIRQISTKDTERIDVWPENRPVWRGITRLVAESLEDVKHVLQIASLQLDTATTMHTPLNFT